MPESKKKLLIIEDEELILRALSEGFKRRGYEILEAIDGKKGMELLEKERPDAVLLDLILPVMTGQEVLAEAVKRGLDKEVPIIVLTNVSDGATLKKCLETGAREYIIKANFSFDEMEAVIKKVMK